MILDFLSQNRVVWYKTKSFCLYRSSISSQLQFLYIFANECIHKCRFQLDIRSASIAGHPRRALPLPLHIQPLQHIRLNLRLQRPQHMRSLLCVRFEFDGSQASGFSLFGEAGLGQLGLLVDRVYLLPDIVMVLKTVYNPVDSVFGFFDELVVVLLGLDWVHVTCRMQQVA